ncbi:hypothetical protein ACFLSJ_08100 [Verrucomicrobiota bacterium]
MRLPWIENYAGTWHDEEGRTLVITTRDDEHATVDLLIDGTPMVRPWCADALAEGLHARYSPADGPDLEIDLGRPGFSLNVNYEFAEPPDEPESLSVGVSMYESDRESDGFGRLFGKLGRYRRADAGRPPPDSPPNRNEKVSPD